jgi:hypothetical protein
LHVGKQPALLSFQSPGQKKTSHSAGFSGLEIDLIFSPVRGQMQSTNRLG